MNIKVIASVKFCDLKYLWDVAKKSTDGPILRTINLSTDNHTLTLATTDGSRIHTLDLGHSDEIINVCVPEAFLKEVENAIKRLKLTPKNTQSLYFTPEEVGFVGVGKHGEVHLNSDYDGGQYPDWRPLVPQTHVTGLSITTKSLLDGLKDLAEGVGPQRVIKVSTKDGRFFFEVYHPIWSGGVYIDGDITGDIDEPVQFAINVDYMIDAIKHVGNGVLTTYIRYRGPNSPVTFHSGNELCKALVMPVKIPTR